MSFIILKYMLIFLLNFDVKSDFDFVLFYLLMFVASYRYFCIGLSV
jgi:hypothetical protein